MLLAREAEGKERAALLRRAADQLAKRGHIDFALAQIDKALALNPGDLPARRQKGGLLAQANKFAAARDWAEAIINDHPKDAANWALLGKIEKAEWISRWRKMGPMPERAAEETHLLVQAIEPFHAAISLDHGDYRSGLNALALRSLLLHLSGADHHPVRLSNLREAVRGAASAAIKKNSADYGARAALGELALLRGDTDEALSAFRDAFRHADWFALNSSRAELAMLGDLEFRAESVAPVLAAIEEEIAKREAPRQARQTFLFSGHMIDRPGRERPRFPAAKEADAASLIAQQLDRFKADDSDLAICGGACGGDLLFAESALQRGLRLDVHLQFAEADFLRVSVAFAGQQWVERYHAVKANPLTQVLVMPDELGDPPEGADPYSRNNLWLLYSALANGPERVRFIALWDGDAADGPGGTKHMVEIVEKHSGQAYILDSLWKENG